MVYIVDIILTLTAIATGLFLLVDVIKGYFKKKKNGNINN